MLLAGLFVVTLFVSPPTANTLDPSLVAALP
jgi:hypothetical protein